MGRQCEDWPDEHRLAPQASYCANTVSVSEDIGERGGLPPERATARNTAVSWEAPQAAELILCKHSIGERGELPPERATARNTAVSWGGAPREVTDAPVRRGMAARMAARHGGSHGPATQRTGAHEQPRGDPPCPSVIVCWRL